MINFSPAAVHVDGTARPQFVDRNYNSKLFKILEAYFKISGINPINTISICMRSHFIISQDMLFELLLTVKKTICLLNILVVKN